MLLQEILIEGFSQSKAIDNLAISVRSLNPLLDSAIKQANGMLKWRDPSQTSQIMRPFGLWVKDNYFHNKQVGGYSVETSLAILRDNPKFKKAASTTIKQTTFFAQTDNPKQESSWVVLTRLIGNITNVLSISHKDEYTKMCNTIINKMTELDSLRKQLRKITTSKSGVDKQNIPIDDQNKKHKLQKKESKRVVGQQNATVDNIISTELKKLPSDVSHVFKQKLDRSDNKIKTLQQLLAQYHG